MRIMNPNISGGRGGHGGRGIRNLPQPTKPIVETNVPPVAPPVATPPISQPIGPVPPVGMKKGGKVSSASKRADGIAQRGKTRGKMV